MLEGEHAGVGEQSGELLSQAFVEGRDVSGGRFKVLERRLQLADGARSLAELDLQRTDALDGAPTGEALFLGSDEVGVGVDDECGCRFVVTDLDGYLVGAGLGEGGSAASAPSAPTAASATAALPAAAATSSGGLATVATVAATGTWLLQRPMPKIPLHAVQPCARRPTQLTHQPSTRVPDRDGGAGAAIVWDGLVILVDRVSNGGVGCGIAGGVDWFCRQPGPD